MQSQTGRIKNTEENNRDHTAVKPDHLVIMKPQETAGTLSTDHFSYSNSMGVPC